jgi:hypothetical protein
VATTALFNSPSGLALNPLTGELFVADSGNDCVRRLRLLLVEEEVSVEVEVQGGAAGDVRHQYLRPFSREVMRWQVQTIVGEGAHGKAHASRQVKWS